MITGIQYLAPDLFSAANDFSNMQASFHFNRFSQSSNSTSDEAEEEQQQQLSIIDERRQRRMISNRESARRSRMRKQKHLDELWAQVMRLRTENMSIIEKLNFLSDCHEKVVQENARLKEEASDLRQMLTDLQIGSPYNDAMRELGEVSINYQNQSNISGSGDLFI